MVMQQLSKRLRRLTQEYMKVCRTAADMTGKNGGNDEKTIEEKTERIIERREGILAYES